MATTYEHLATALGDRYRIERELGTGGVVVACLGQSRGTLLAAARSRRLAGPAWRKGLERIP